MNLAVLSLTIALWIGIGVLWVLICAMRASNDRVMMLQKITNLAQSDNAVNAAILLSRFRQVSFYHHMWMYVFFGSPLKKYPQVLRSLDKRIDLRMTFKRNKPR